MSRNSQMIPIRAEALKGAIKERGAISSLTRQLGVSKQAISNWLNQERISPSHLKIIVEALNFSASEIKEIVGRNKSLELYFRTSRNTPATEQDRQSLDAISDCYLSIVSEQKDTPDSSKFSLRVSDPVDAAVAILKQIGMNDENISLSSLIEKLSLQNIHVLFLDFEKLLPVERLKKTSRPRAFCATKSGLSIIAIDLNEKLDDMPFLALHELAHILLGHLQEPSDELIDERETLCNEVASEAQHPSKFYRQEAERLKAELNGSYQEMIFRVEDLAETRNSSFMGAILALRRHQLISEDRSRYLFAVNSRRSGQQERLSDLLPMTVDGWQKALRMKDLRKYFKAQLFFKRRVLRGQVSTDLCADVFGLNEQEMGRLIGLWESEYAETDPS